MCEKVQVRKQYLRHNPVMLTKYYSLFRHNILQPSTLQRLFSRYSFIRIQFQHTIEQIKRIGRHKGELFPHAALVVPLRSQRVPERQVDDIRPNAGDGGAANAGYHF